MSKRMVRIDSSEFDPNVDNGPYNEVVELAVHGEDLIKIAYDMSLTPEERGSSE